MKKTLILLAASLSVAGCIHKMDIQQGNIIDEKKVSKLHSGMTQEQVQALMGTPVLINTFNEDRRDYVYTFKSGQKPTVEKRVVLTFQDDHLKNIQL
jgi:outer membrane protein assembly factor BamE